MDLFKTSKKRQEERMAGEMSTKLVFSPQCTKCANNIDGKRCEVFIQIPSIYMQNELECLDFKEETDEGI